MNLIRDLFRWGGVTRFVRSRASKTCVPKLELGNEVTRSQLASNSFPSSGLGTPLPEAPLRRRGIGSELDSGIVSMGKRDSLRAKQSFEDLRSQAGAWERVAGWSLGPSKLAGYTLVWVHLPARYRQATRVDRKILSAPMPIQAPNKPSCR